MLIISKEKIKHICSQKDKRICFSTYKDHHPKETPNSKQGYHGTLNWPFYLGMKEMILLNFIPNKSKGGNHVWYPINTKEEFIEIRNFCDQRSPYVYLYNCLSITAALSFNKPNNTTSEYTDVGRLVSCSKEAKNIKAIAELVKLSCDFMDLHPSYKEIDFICSIPAPHKTYDLPRCLASDISTQLGVTDITNHFIFDGKKQTTKTIEDDDADFFEKKWGIWEQAKIRYEGPSLKGKKILLIDDNYQSGISVQFLGMKLAELGSDKIFCLCMTKTLRDRGN